MSGNNEFKRVCEQLDIDYDIMMTDVDGFISQCVKRAKELAADLEKRDTVTDIEANFKAQSRKDMAAVNRAAEVYDQILDLILAESPEVMANLIPLFADAVQVTQSNVRTQALRQYNLDSGYLSKKQKHLLYISLKKCYDTFGNFAKLMYGATNVPIIPAKSGNYGNEGMAKTYLWFIDGEDYISPYTVARKLGLRITHYMDMIDIIDTSDGQIGTHKVSYKEL